MTATPVVVKENPNNEALLEVKDLEISFRTEDGMAQAVRGVSYRLASGEVLAIVGESGSGKSVTGMAILGLLPKSARTSGSVRFKGTELLGRSEKELMKVRGDGIAMVFQDPMTALNPVYTIGWQVAEAVHAHRNLSKKDGWNRAVEFMSLAGIPEAEKRATSYPHEFSGGMRQRAAIAIAMANNPDVMIADEPTTALDVTVQAQVLESLRSAQNETGAALVLITHDLGIVAGLADRVAVMYAGKLVEIGTVDEIFYDPRMPYTGGLIGSLPRLDRQGERLRPITGSPPSLVAHTVGCPFAPRCPLVQQLCYDVEPELKQTSTSYAVSDNSHAAACHFSDQLGGTKAIELFAPISTDIEIQQIKGQGP